MPNARFRYMVFDVMTRQYLGDLNSMTEVTFNDPVTGSGTLQATLPVGSDLDAAERTQLNTRIQKLRSWILCVQPNTRQILWNGIITSAPWNMRDSLTLTAQQMTWYPSQRLLGTEAVAKSWSSKDRFVIAREVMQLMAAQPGTPRIVYDTTLSGKTFTYKIEARSFTSVTEILDEIGSGEDGFEWDLLAEWDPSDGLPRLRFKTYFQQQTGPFFSLDYRDSGPSDIISFPNSEWADDAEGSATRVWALGAGSEAAQIVGEDTDPATKKSLKLLTEKTSTFENINTKAALVKNAYKERTTISAGSATPVFTVSYDNPVYGTYTKGSRMHLTIKDSWHDITLPNVRIIDINYNDQTESGQDNVAGVDLTIDLQDHKFPDGESVS